MNILTKIPPESLLKLVLRLALAAIAYIALDLMGFHRFFAKDAEGLRELTQITGEVYAVLLAFIIFVIWGQFNEVENLVIQEANTLDDLMRFRMFLSADLASTIKTAVSRYARYASDQEWSELADGRKDPRADEIFAGLNKSVVDMQAENLKEQALYARFLELLDRAGMSRDQRTAKSLTRMPPTLSSLVRILAIVLLALMFVYPFSHWIVGLSIFTALTFVLFVAEFVIMDTDNPLKGVWNVTPRPLEEIGHYGS